MNSFRSLPFPGIEQPVHFVGVADAGEFDDFAVGDVVDITADGFPVFTAFGAGCFGPGNGGAAAVHDLRDDVEIEIGQLRAGPREVAADFGHSREDAVTGEGDGRVVVDLGEHSFSVPGEIGDIKSVDQLTSGGGGLVHQRSSWVIDWRDVAGLRSRAIRQFRRRSRADADRR